MKNFVLIGLVVLVACHQAYAESSKSFSEDIANLTNNLLSSEKNVSNIETLNVQLDAFERISNDYILNRELYRRIFTVIYKLRYTTYRFLKSSGILEQVVTVEDEFDQVFDELNIQKDVDESKLPSTVNELIDNFINKYTKPLHELFQNIFTKANQLGGEAEGLAAETIKLTTNFAEEIEKCMDIPRTQFMELFQCRQKTKKVLPPLAHNSARLENIIKELETLIGLPMDGKHSWELFRQMSREKIELLEHIQEVKNHRE